MEVFRAFKKENCEERRNKKDNLTDIEMKGFMSLKEKIKESELVASKTNKSGKMTLITMEENIKLGIESAKEDKEIDIEEVMKIQSKNYDTTRY